MGQQLLGGDDNMSSGNATMCHERCGEAQAPHWLERYPPSSATAMQATTAAATPPPAAKRTWRTLEGRVGCAKQALCADGHWVNAEAVHSSWYVRYKAQQPHYMVGIQGFAEPVVVPIRSSATRILNAVAQVGAGGVLHVHAQSGSKQGRHLSLRAPSVGRKWPGLPWTLLTRVLDTDRMLLQGTDP
jgi:hypothetical protein